MSTIQEITEEIHGEYGIDGLQKATRQFEQHSIEQDILEHHYANEINHGRLYPNLNELAEMGLVEKGSVDDRTNPYGLTKRGHREIEARREWEDQYVAVEA